MRLCLMIQQRLELTQCLDLTGGHTDTIFPEVEALLKSTEYQKALDYVAKRKNADKYESVMDFIFCELFPKWRTKCFRYYLSRKPKDRLKNQISEARRTLYAWTMLQALHIAYAAFCEDRKLSWSGLRQETHNAIAS